MMDAPTGRGVEGGEGGAMGDDGWRATTRVCPYGGMDGVVVVERVRQYGWAVPEPPVRE